MKRYPTTLIIAGSDSSAGAGIQADLKTCLALGVYATTAITAITAQNTMGVRGVMPVTPDMVQSQIEAVLDDYIVDSIKIGMLCNADIARAVADVLSQHRSIPVVLDPVMVSTSGHKLIEDEAIAVIRERLFPLVEVITPNVAEAVMLSGVAIHTIEDMSMAAIPLLDSGCKAVLIKGGHLQGDSSVDILFTADGALHRYAAPYCPSHNTHGTGCTLSSAIAAHIARGCNMVDAIGAAKQYVTDAITAGASVFSGHGHGALNHGFAPCELRADKEFIEPDTL